MIDGEEEGPQVGKGGKEETLEVTDEADFLEVFVGVFCLLSRLFALEL